MDERRCAVIYLIIIYLFNRFHHGYNIMKRLGLNIHFDNITRTRDDSAGHTTEGGSKSSAVCPKTSEILTMLHLKHYKKYKNPISRYYKSGFSIPQP